MLEIKSEVMQITGLRLTDKLVETNQKTKNDGRYHVTARISFRETGDTDENKLSAKVTISEGLAKRLNKIANDGTDKHCIEFVDLLFEENELSELGFSYDKEPDKEVQKAVCKAAAKLLKDEGGNYIQYPFSLAIVDAVDVLKKCDMSTGIDTKGNKVEFTSFYSVEGKRAYSNIYAARLGERSKEYMERRITRQIAKAVTRLQSGEYTPGDVETDVENYERWKKALKNNESGTNGKVVDTKRLQNADADPDEDGLDF